VQIDLCGKSALITGGAGGIGRACAETLAAAGARVFVADINLEGAEAAAAAIQDCMALQVDLRDEKSVAAMCDTLNSAYGGIDILVNTAGIISYRKGIQAVEPKEWDLVLDVNMKGTYLVCRGLMEGMKAKGHGKIINFSSLAARVGGIEVGMHYAASKAALIGFTRTLAKEGGPCGVNVNAVAPGIIATEPVKKQVAGHEEAYTANIPMKRLGEPEDVANVVLFLASPLSDYITGATLDINGGMYMG